MSARHLLLWAVLSGCGLFKPSGAADAGTNPCVDDPTTTITVTPAMVRMRPGDTLTFTWDIRSKRGSALAAPSMEGGGGSVVPGGNNTVRVSAPPVPGTYFLDVTRIGCPGDVGQATITVEPLADPGPAPGVQPVPTGVDWSPDGTKVAVAGRGGLWLFGPDGTFLESVKLPHQGKMTVAFSPDGAFVAVGGDRAAPVWILRTEGLTPWTTAGGPGTGGVVYAADGSELYVHKGDKVLAVSTTTGATREVSAISPGTSADSVPRIELGPLGSLLVTVPGELRELSTGRRMTRWSVGVSLDGVVIAPDASWVLNANLGLHYPFFPAQGGGGGGGFFTGELAASGLVALGHTGAVSVVRVTNGAVVNVGGATLPGSPGKVLDVAWSPDESKLAVAGSGKLFILSRADLGL